jgi:2-dehydro-3-deoxygluconokinase
MQLLVAEPGVALRHALHYRAGVAGAETNVAIGVARQGHSVRWLSRLGTDPAGEFVLARLRAESVDVSAVELDADRPTGLLVRDSHPRRPVAVQYFRTGSAASALSADYVRKNWPLRTRLVHVSGITPMLSPAASEATSMLLKLARENGAMISFDPNVRRKLGSDEQWQATVGPLLEQADLIFAGSDELAMITGTNDPQRLLDRGTSAVLIKHPDRSVELSTPEDSWRRQSLVTSVVDAVGAGDALVAGYLAAWLRQCSPVDSLLAALATAALVVESVTDSDGLPNRSELEIALRNAAGSSDEMDR